MHVCIHVFVCVYAFVCLCTCVLCVCVFFVCMSTLPGVNSGSKFPVVLVLLSGVGVVVELQVLLPLSMKLGQSSCRLAPRRVVCTRRKCLSSAQASQY